MQDGLLISVMHVGSTDPAIPHHSVRNPTWEQIEEAVRPMNGHARSEVIIVVDDDVDHALMLGGGADDRYVCNAEFHRGQFVLCDLTRPKGKPVPINTGQPSLYDPQHVVDLEKLLQATRYFAIKGERDPSLSWFKY
jgi:hypothetical protein